MVKNQWDVIRRKCYYIFQQVNRETDQEELLNFMKIFICDKTKLIISPKTDGLFSKVPSMPTKKHKAETSSSEDLPDEDELHFQDNVSTLNRELDNNCISEEPIKPENDGYRLAIAQAFNYYFEDGDARLDAMLQLCTEIKKFKIDKEKFDNNANLR